MLFMFLAFNKGPQTNFVRRLQSTTKVHLFMDIPNPNW